MGRENFGEGLGAACKACMRACMGAGSFFFFLKNKQTAATKRKKKKKNKTEKNIFLANKNTRNRVGTNIHICTRILRRKKQNRKNILLIYIYIY